MCRVSHKCNRVFWLWLLWERSLTHITRNTKTCKFLTSHGKQGTFQQTILQIFCTQARIIFRESLPFWLNWNVYFFACMVGPNKTILNPYLLLKSMIDMTSQEKTYNSPRGCEKFYILWCHFFWPFMSIDAYHSVWNCNSCAKVDLNVCNEPIQMKFFPTTESVAFVCADVIGNFITLGKHTLH